jgi:hypothetical protein
VKSWAGRNHEWTQAVLDGGPGEFIWQGRDQNASRGQGDHECNYGFESPLHLKVLMPGWWSPLHPNAVRGAVITASHYSKGNALFQQFRRSPMQV